MTTCDVLVVGGGISGLSFAHFAAEAGRAATVLEAEGAPGGCIQSKRAGGFWFELGAHTCYSSYAGLWGLIQACGLSDQLLARKKVGFCLLVDGEIRPIMKELSIGELLLSAPRILATKKAGLSVESYYSRIVGKGNYARVFGALFSAVPSQPAGAFPAEMLFKKRKRVPGLLGSYSLQGGLQTITDALAKRPRVTVEVGASARSVERAGGGWAVGTLDGRRFEARHLALAVPPPVAGALLGPSLPILAAQLGRIRHATIDTVGVVVEKAAVPVRCFAGVVPTSDLFFSAVSRDVVEDERYRGFAFHFRPGIPLDDRVRRISEVLRVDRTCFEHVTTRTVVLPSPVVGHAQVVAEIDRQLPPSGLYVTGNFFGGLAIEDCVLRSAAEARRMAAAG